MPPIVFDVGTRGSNEQNGVARHCWIARYEDFDTIAQLPASPSTQAEKVTISDDHTFGVGAGFEKLYVDQRKTNYQVTGTGSVENKGGRAEVVAMFPGTKKEFDAFLKDNPELICLVEDPDCSAGVKKQIGTKCSPARIDVDWTYNSGTVGEDEDRGYAFKIFAHQSGNLYYEGALTEAAE